MPVMDPELKRIAQKAKYRIKKHCRKCGKNQSINAVKCKRCGSRNLRVVDHSSPPARKGSGR